MPPHGHRGWGPRVRLTSDGGAVTAVLVLLHPAVRLQPEYREWVLSVRVGILVARTKNEPLDALRAALSRWLCQVQPPVVRSFRGLHSA